VRAAQVAVRACRGVTQDSPELAEEGRRPEVGAWAAARGGAGGGHRRGWRRGRGGRRVDCRGRAGGGCWR
jgi:hypothetical protein